MSEALPTSISVNAEAAGQRLDQFMAAKLDVSRARVQQLIAEQKIVVNDAAAKAIVGRREEPGVLLTPPSSALPASICQPPDVVLRAK